MLKQKGSIHSVTPTGPDENGWYEGDEIDPNGDGSGDGEGCADGSGWGYGEQWGTGLVNGYGKGSGDGEGYDDRGDGYSRGETLSGGDPLDFDGMGHGEFSNAGYLDGWG